VTVLTGPFPAARLLEEEPDFIVSSFREVYLEWQVTVELGEHCFLES
jgi:hypothetical protein